MNIIRNFFLMCATFVMAIACNPDTNTAEGDCPSISIKLTSEAPVNARPGEEVSYTFSLSYENGLSEAVAMLGKEEIEGTKATFSGAPVEETYSFTYTPASAQTGSTLDFVIAVSGADGAEKTYDIPLYVLAEKADIKITIPSEAPENHELGTDLSFTVNVTSSTDIINIKTLKNSAELPELTLTEFTDRKNIDYTFTYSPEATDVGAPVTFTFQVMDTNGNILSQDYAVTFTKPVSAELNEFYAVTMGYQNCTTAGPYLSSSTGQVFMIPDGGENSSLIDIVIYYSGNQTSQGLGVTSPTSPNAVSMYGNLTTVTGKGGDENDVITNWTVKNTVTFKLLSGKIKGEEKADITLEEFSELSKAKELEDLYNNSDATENVTALMVQPESIFAFKTSADKFGVLRIVSRDANNKGTVVVDVKTIK